VIAARRLRRRQVEREGTFTTRCLRRIRIPFDGYLVPYQNTSAREAAVRRQNLRRRIGRRIVQGVGDEAVRREQSRPREPRPGIGQMTL